MPGQVVEVQAQVVDADLVVRPHLLAHPLRQAERHVGDDLLGADLVLDRADLDLAVHVQLVALELRVEPPVDAQHVGHRGVDLGLGLADEDRAVDREAGVLARAADLRQAPLELRVAFGEVGERVAERARDDLGLHAEPRAVLDLPVDRPRRHGREPQRRVRAGHRPRQHRRRRERPEAALVPGVDVAAPALRHDLEVLEEVGAARVDVHLTLEAHGLEAGGAAADGELEAAGVHDVELRDAAGELQRMVVAQDDDGDAHADPLRPLEDAYGELERVGQQVVVVEVVLDEPDDVVPEAVGGDRLCRQVLEELRLAAGMAEVVGAHEDPELHASSLLIDRSVRRSAYATARR